MASQTSTLCSLAAVLLCAAGALATEKPQRALLQQQAGQYLAASTSLYRPTTSGGLALFSNFTVISDGQRAIAYPLNASSNGSTLVLQQYVLRRTPVIQNAGCISVGLQTNSSRVQSFLTTYADYLNMLQGDYFVLSAANAIVGTNLTNSSQGPALVAVDPAQQYVNLVFSLDSRPQVVVSQLTTYAPNASACSAAAPAVSAASTVTASNQTGLSLGASATPSAAPPTVTRGSGRRLAQTSGAYSPALAPAPSASQTQTVQLAKQDVLSDGSIVAPAAFTNASCIGYKLFGQDPMYAQNHRIDVTVAIVDLPNMLRWAAQSFSFRPTNVTFQASCLQNTTNPGDCGSYLNNLDPTQIYFVFGITGIQQVRVISSDVIFNLAFTAQSSGSCANNAVQSYSTGVQFSLVDSSDYYDYEDRADGPASPDTGVDSLAPLLGGSTAPSGTAAAPAAGAQAAQPPGGIVLYGSSQEGGQLFPLPGK